MKIDYYIIGHTGAIHKHYIDTESENYFSHTDHEVTIIYKELDEDYYFITEKVTYPRIFETAQLERIATYKERIESLQKDLAVFENSKDYDHYWELVEKNR
jgi:hypothetical protein